MVLRRQDLSPHTSLSSAASVPPTHGLFSPCNVLVVVFILSLCGCNDRGKAPVDSGKSSPGVSDQNKEEDSYYERTGNPDRVIVFVHGIFGTSRDTWNCSKDISWPKLLKEDKAFDRSDIYVAGYKSPYYGNTKTIDEVVLNLKGRLQSDEVFSKHREVVFVAHSLGGLVVQRFLLTYRELAKQVPFIYFYSTPQTGAKIAAVGKIFSSDPLLKEMIPGDPNDYLLNLESEWRNAGFSAIRRYCAYEKKPYKGVLVVERLSGTRTCDEVVPIDEDHSSIVKPCTRNKDSYIALRNAIIQNPIKPKQPEFKTETATRTWESYQEVGCNKTNSQTLKASVELDPKFSEKVIAASAALDKADNIKGAAPPTLGPLQGNTVEVHYGFNGLDAGLFGCPGGGHATVTVKFVVQREVPVN